MSPSILFACQKFPQKSSISLGSLLLAENNFYGKANFPKASERVKLARKEKKKWLSPDFLYNG